MTVISLDKFKKKKEDNTDVSSPEGTVSLPDNNIDEYIDDVVKKNLEKKQKLKEERQKANQGVIRSYRLKH